MVPLSDELIEHSILLAQLDLPKEPKQVNLRRAVSAAYYALFQLFTSEAAGNWANERQRHRFSRLFDHGRMKTACTGLGERLKRRLGENPTPERVEIATKLRVCANAFMRLQEERHTADYDNAVVWSRTEAYNRILLAQSAIATWRAIRDHDIAQDFLLDLLGK